MTAELVQRLLHLKLLRCTKALNKPRGHSNLKLRSSGVNDSSHRHNNGSSNRSNNGCQPQWGQWQFQQQWDQNQSQLQQWERQQRNPNQSQ